MSIFIAFRTAAVSVLRPPRASRLALPLFSPIVATSVRGIVARSHPKNSQIQFEVVQLQDADGTLHHPHKLSKILEDVDTDTHVVRLISHDPPIVRVFTLLEDKMRKVEMKEKRKVKETKRQVLDKEVKMTWFTSGQDFDMKLAKIHEELSKGDVRMEISFNPKPRVENPPFRDMMDQYRTVVARLQDVSVEWRQYELRRGVLTVYLQSTLKRQAKALPTQEEVEEKALEEIKRQERQILRKKQKLGDPAP